MIEVVETASGTVVVETTSDTVVIETPAVEHIELGIQGPPGPPGTGAAIVYSFAWGDATPAQIAVALAGKTVFKVEVIIKTPFDATPTFSIGDSVGNDRLFANTDIDAVTAGVYQTNPGYTYVAETPINLYITPGNGTTTGNGLILIYIEA